MKVFRLCRKEEIHKAIEEKTFENAGNVIYRNDEKNTHNYVIGTRYLHFFDDELNLLYLHPQCYDYVCVFDIPESILAPYAGKGKYIDFTQFRTPTMVMEYAVPSSVIKFKHLEKVYDIRWDFDFDYVPLKSEIYKELTLIFEDEILRLKLEELLTCSDVHGAIISDQNYLFSLLPELKKMVGFRHKHPHHHLDVWKHTLLVVKNLNTTDFELNLAGLLHDIGKPYSYQDEEVRHFRGHTTASLEQAKKILPRLGYSEEFSERIFYIVKNHDAPIDPNNLDNTMELILKRLELQYADAKAHHPDKVAQRLVILDAISEKLKG